jgi:hypothetical protein
VVFSQPIDALNSAFFWVQVKPLERRGVGFVLQPNLQIKQSSGNLFSLSVMPLGIESEAQTVGNDKRTLLNLTMFFLFDRSVTFFDFAFFQSWNPLDDSASATHTLPIH